MFNKSNLLPFFFYLLLILLFCGSIFFNIDYWGQYDWDDLFYCGLERVTVLKYHQLPLWNPYVGGGNLMLAHPHSSLFSPFFIPILIFGELLGMKINIIIFLLFGMLGMYFLSRKLRLSEFSSFLSGIIFMCSSWYPLKMLLGHIYECNIAWVPWVLLFYLKSLEKKRFIICASIFFSFIITSGAVDTSRCMILILPLYAILKSIQAKKFRPFSLILVLFLVTFLLTAAKTFPMMEFISAHKRVVGECFGSSLSVIKEILLNKNHFELQENFLGDWFEIGGYVGIIAMVLYAVGVCFRGKSHWPLLIVQLFILILMLANNFVINVWMLIRYIPFFHDFQIPGRSIAIFVFVLSLFAAMGLDFLERKISKEIFRKLIAGCICLFIILDLYAANSHIFNKIFIAPPPAIKADREFTQDDSNSTFLFERNSLYPSFLKNRGEVGGFGILDLKKGKIKFRAHKDNNMKYWAGKELLFKEKPEVEFIDFSNLADKKEGSIGEWQIFPTIYGSDSEIYHFCFAENNSRPSDWHLGYILFYVYSPSARKGIIKAGGITGVNLWINKEKIFEHFGIEGKRKGVKIDVSLKEGWNSFLFGAYTLAQEYRNWGIGIKKITDERGKSYEDLIYNLFKGEKRINDEDDEVYRGEAYFLDSSNTARIKFFSPNKVIILAISSQTDTMVLNQNYHSGWRVKIRDSNSGIFIPAKVIAYEGLVAVKIPAGNYTITLDFFPIIVKVGIIISILTILTVLCSVAFWHLYENRKAAMLE